MRKLSILIFLIFFACSKKSEAPQEPQNPTSSNYDIIQYWGFDIGKSHKYYVVDTFKLTVPNLIDTTMVSQDTLLRVIQDTFGNLNVIFYDTFFISQTKIYDTLYVYNPFVLDTIRTLNIFNNSSPIAIGNKIFKAPLSQNDTWTPIEQQSKAINDTIKISTQQLGSCTLWVFLDTLKIDSSKKIVLEASSDTSFKLFSKLYSKIKYHYQTKPQTQLCSDTTMKSDTANMVVFDTTYLKAYLGITRTYTFDSTYAQFQIGPLPLQTIYRSYERRVRVQ